MSKVAQRVVRNNVGFDDRLGRTMQRTGAAVVLVPDPLVYSVAVLLTKNPATAAKITAGAQALGLGLVGIGTALRNLD